MRAVGLLAAAATALGVPGPLWAQARADHRPPAAQLGPRSPPPPIPRSWSAAERQAAAQITPAEISAHLSFLASDLTEGREPGTRGSELTIAYLAAGLQALDLQPGAPGAHPEDPPTFLQPVPLVELRARVPHRIELSADGKPPLALRAGEGVSSDLVIDPDAHVDVAKLAAAELVFVGYGIVAPEYGWDDYKGQDLRGKVAVILNFNPPFRGEGVRLWYGRWDYKFQTAAAHGAAAAMVIHTDASAGYPWQVLAASADGSRIDLPPEGEPRMQLQGWIAQPAARRAFALGGHDYAELEARATGSQAKSFSPVPLGVRLSLQVPVSRRRIPSFNVVARLPGSDPALADEAVLYTAHHDHLGKKPAPPGQDGIYNGALDNASGCATVLAIARGAAAARPRRSMLFAFVTAEESGLLGSRWLARHPPVPPGRLVADINLDSVNRLGRSADLDMLGLGKSSLDAVVREVASSQGRTVHGDAFPAKGSFYRSDQFELARIGVPVVAVRGGPTFLGRPADWGRKMREEFDENRYHQVSDEYAGDWDLSGTVEDAQLQLVVGLRVANAPAQPTWTPGDEFERARQAALSALKPAKSAPERPPR